MFFLNMAPSIRIRAFTLVCELAKEMNITLDDMYLICDALLQEEKNMTQFRLKEFAAKRAIKDSSIRLDAIVATISKSHLTEEVVGRVIAALAVLRE